MNVSATGIVIDHYGDVLLIQRDDTRTLAPPGGAAEIGELPTETVAREVREETGLIVMPVRLVGLHYMPTRTADYLSFTFRCIMRGGELTPSIESPRAGFFKTNPYPKPMLDFHKERIQKSLAHRGGPPNLETYVLPFRLRLAGFALRYIIYPWMDFRRRRQGLATYVPPPRWKVQASVILRDGDDRVLWVKSKAASGEWVLPIVTCKPGQSPWEAAVQMIQKMYNVPIKLTDVYGIYPAQDEPSIVISFGGHLAPHNQNIPQGEDMTFFAPGDEPTSANSRHVQQIKDAESTEQPIVYRLI